jgi:hypothetical protein
MRVNIREAKPLRNGLQLVLGNLRNCKPKRRLADESLDLFYNQFLFANYA